MSYFRLTKNSLQLKTKGFTFLFILLPLLLFSQNNQSIDMMGSVGHSYRHLSTTSQDDFIIKIMERRDDEETGRIAYSFGINYNKNLSNNTYIRTGIQFSSLAYKSAKKTNLIWSGEFEDVGSVIEDPSLPKEIQFFRNFLFIDIPVAGRFEFNTKKLSPFVELGISPSVYITTQTKVETDIDTRIEFVDGTNYIFKRINFNGFVSLGLQYAVSDTYRLFVQALSKYYITPFTNAPINERLFKNNIQFGIRRKLN